LPLFSCVVSFNVSVSLYFLSQGIQNTYVYVGGMWTHDCWYLHNIHSVR